MMEEDLEEGGEEAMEDGEIVCENCGATNIGVAGDVCQDCGSEL